MGKRPFRLFGILHTASKPPSLAQGRSRACSATDLRKSKTNQSKGKQPLRRGGFTAPRHLPWLRGGSMLVYIKLIDGLPTT